MPCRGVLGIIGCYGLSDQIIQLIGGDEDIENVFVVNNAEGKRFAHKARERSILKNLVPVDADERIHPGKGDLSILLWLNPEGLHDRRNIHTHHQEVLSSIADHVDAVLFFYGLCRSPEQKLVELTDEAPVPTTFLTDMDGEIVDDCFAAVLGGKRDYLDCFMCHKHTLLVTSGYAESWRRKREQMDIPSMVEEVEGLRYMFETMGYHRLLKLDDAAGDEERFDEDVRAFSRLFDLELDVRECCSPVFEHSYALAKESMQYETRGDMAGTTASRLVAQPWCQNMRRDPCEYGAIAGHNALLSNIPCLPDRGGLSRRLP